jgi:AraC-like DNA-binding protein
MQIKHIAFEVGYDNHSKFSAAFRKIRKLPSDIRLEKAHSFS